MATLSSSNGEYLLSTYDISSYGFLTDPTTIPDVLPYGFEEYQIIVDSIENEDGEYFRRLVDDLKVGKPHSYYIEKVERLNYVEKKQIYSLFTFVAQKYVRCMGKVDESEQIKEIPYEIGLIWNECAKEFDLPCVTSYGAVILYNCKLNEEGNIVSRHAISGTNDELHFYKVHMDLEKIGGKLLEKMYYYDPKNKADLIELLIQINQTIKEITKTMKKMYDGCDPKIFWSVVRLYLGGYTKDNGLPDGLGVTGTNLKFKFGGGSAAQSTLIQAIDIVLNIPHDSEHGVKFLAEQRKYMPKKHQKFLIDLEQKHKNLPLRELVDIINDDALLEEYNNTVNSLKLFRLAHYNIVHKYVDQFIETKKWYIKLIDSVFGERSKVAKQLKSFVKNVNSNLSRNNLHGANGSGGLPTEQLEHYINDTERQKIVRQERFIFKLMDTWWFWLCLLYIMSNTFQYINKRM